MKVRISVVLVAILFAGTFAAIADPTPPTHPPGWGWPNGDYNGYWDYPTGTAWENPSPNSSWTVTDGGVTTFEGVECYGITNNTGQEQEYTFTLEIGNSHVENRTKMLWIQYDVYFSDEYDVCDTDVEGDIDYNWGTDDTIENLLDVDVEELGDGWWRYWEFWEIIDQPNREKVEFSFLLEDGDSAGMANVYYSTLCVPEPGTMAMLAMGALGTIGILRRRRK